MSTVGAKVLVIDDDPDIIKLFNAALTAAGCQVFAALDTIQGFPLARRVQPDLILLDLHMPGGGLIMLDRLKKTSFGAHIPVIIITANTESAVWEQCMAGGAEAVHAKPLTPSVLQGIVAEALAAHAPQPKPSAGAPANAGRLPRVTRGNVLDPLPDRVSSWRVSPPGVGERK